MTTLEAAWERIEAWYAAQGALDQLRPGAPEEQIAALEAFLGYPVSDDLRASLRRHDGSVEGGWPTGTLLDTAASQDEATVWRQLLDGGDFDDNAEHDASDGREQVERGWWSHGWVPLDADGGGNGAVVDMTPGPAGTVGQVLDMDHEVGPSGPQHGNLAGYLEEIASTLESGEYVVADGGVYAADEVEDE
ncbi:cell wall assembly regulator SMI1 [Deinococcus metalli]|uniref:Cell wall assembly regulator SMI1 n=1 Tax=Deinococcus metalli TaxID=1141878 RepID=A0A7W8KGW1_9DEIO|nr:SMI1/KNR4 family protein [Deinococcus metalli]MBB5377951.1 cell wall assembly regulator SMI1 [Deinococcus metalli]GHF54902.1 glucan synthase [Deinococcus metalli]